MAQPCLPWEVDPEALGVCSGWAEYSQETKDQALILASTFLWAATGRRYGSCPVTIRPARARGWEPVQYQVFPVTPGAQGLNQPGGPFLFGGQWFNAGCAIACCGNRECALVLRGPVTGVEDVFVDGELVLASAYRVDVSRGVYLLVRIDGECWPICQNLTAEPTEPGTFEVTYDVGVAIPPALLTALALLACEYGKSLTGGACALPARMTRLSRQGIEVEVAPPDPENGLTGIKIVDDIVTALNPSRRHSPPRVMSPDLDNCDRITVVPAGS